MHLEQELAWEELKRQVQAHAEATEGANKKASLRRPSPTAAACKHRGLSHQLREKLNATDGAAEESLSQLTVQLVSWICKEDLQPDARISTAEAVKTVYHRREHERHSKPVAAMRPATAAAASIQRGQCSRRPVASPQIATSSASCSGMCASFHSRKDHPNGSLRYSAPP